MDEFITRFTSLLRYVPYIREEKAKVQRFVSSLPPYMRERIEFDNSKLMDEVIRKARICYQQSKQKGEAAGRKWNEKKGFKSIGYNKGNRNSGSKGNGKGQNSRTTTRTTSKFRPTNESKVCEQHARLDSEVGEIGRSVPRINAALEDRQAEYQPTMVEFEANQLVKCIQKGCQVYAIQVGYANSKDKTAVLNNIPVIQEFADVFPEEIPGLPPRRNIDFTIELVPGAAPVSRAPYRMSVPELTELKM
eukprot:PITA_23108